MILLMYMQINMSTLCQVMHEKTKWASRSHNRQIPSQLPKHDQLPGFLPTATTMSIPSDTRMMQTYIVYAFKLHTTQLSQALFLLPVNRWGRNTNRVSSPRAGKSLIDVKVLSKISTRICEYAFRNVTIIPHDDSVIAIFLVFEPRESCWSHNQ